MRGTGTQRRKPAKYLPVVSKQMNANPRLTIGRGEDHATGKLWQDQCTHTHQNLDGQLGTLRAERVDVILREKASGKSVKGRPELEKAIDELGTGDILVVAEWDRGSRSMFDGIHLIERINARGALIKVLDKPHLDLTTPLGRGFIAFLSALAGRRRAPSHPQARQRWMQAAKAKASSSAASPS